MKELTYRLKYWYHFVKTGLLRGLPASIKHKHPARKLKIIAITGTDGKTTSSAMLYHVLKKAGKKVALLSTVAAYIGDKKIETGLHTTSPDAHDLQKLMAKMVKEKVEYLVMEYTSHGAYQNRVWGITPTIAGVTNVTHEHLDYHLNYNNYLEAKALLLKKSPIVVLNRDDQSFNRIRNKYLTPSQTSPSYSIDDPLKQPVRSAIENRFVEQYNQMNARLVTKLAEKIGLNQEQIAKGIETFPGVPGRMQFIPTRRKIKIVVDFAHTPNALEKALIALRKHMRKDNLDGKLIAVYGSAGLRDYAKRPMMGEVGVNHADLIVLTAEDPRTEDVWSIIRQMKEKLTHSHSRIISIADREEAINFAINKLAKAGDMVAILGKGPEKSMCYGKVEYPWSDEEAVKRSLSKA